MLLHKLDCSYGETSFATQAKMYSKFFVLQSIHKSRYSPSEILLSVLAPALAVPRGDYFWICRHSAYKCMSSPAHCCISTTVDQCRKVLNKLWICLNAISLEKTTHNFNCHVDIWSSLLDLVVTSLSNSGLPCLSLCTCIRLYSYSHSF